MQSEFGDMASSTMVACPICQAQMPETEINDHLDICVGDSPKKRHRTSGPSALGSASNASADENRSDCITICVDENLPHLIACREAPLDMGSWMTTNSVEATAQHLRQPSLTSDEIAVLQLSGQGVAEETMDSDAKKPIGDAVPQTLAKASHRSPYPQEACPLTVVAPMQPEDHLMAQLLGSRTHALRCARDDSERMHSKVAQVCGEVQNSIEMRREQIQGYSARAKPSDYSQQRARNDVREELTDAAWEAQSKLSFVIAATREPGEMLCRAEADQIQNIDDVICMLQQFRAETLDEFQRHREEETVKFKASESTTQTLEQSLMLMDCFVRHLSEEIEGETTTAIEVHTEKLDQLQQEQVRFVSANDAPQRNPIFAKVIEDIASTNRVLAEHSSQRETCRDLEKGWKDTLEKMPKQKQVAPVHAVPQKRTLLDRILGRA
jgi:hypothetical protein